TPWADVRLSADDWAEAFDAVEPGTPHNEARESILEALVTILMDRHEGDDDTSPKLLRRSLLQHGELRSALTRAWPLIEATDLVGDLWTVPAYLRRCAPWLGADDVGRLQRPDATAWTVSPPPVLDAAPPRPRRPGPPPTCRSWMRPGSASATRRRRGASARTTPPSPPNARGWRPSST